MAVQKSKRPHRQRKGDRLLYSGAPANEVQCDYAVAPLDRLATQMDEKWGIDRLPELVDPEMAERYGSAIAKLNAALQGGDPKLVAHKAQVCMRGLAVMDQAAVAAGQPQASPDYWEYEFEGKKIAVMRDGMHWQACKAERPDLTFYTMREVAVALAALKLDNPIFETVKQHFPQAEVSAIADRSRLERQLDDEIPF